MGFFKGLNPDCISTKAATMALVSNAVEGVKHLPGTAMTKLSSIKGAKAEKAMKSKMAVITELNEVEKTIEDLTARGVAGIELTTALDYAAVLRSKLM